MLSPAAPRETITALSGTVKQAERLLQMAEKGVEYGVKTRLEVDDAQTNLLRAMGMAGEQEL
ncbi:TolC family protein [Trichlorobacter lovleyi]|uniref:TolC family protein n=1 Tax=Trichlorobacter lovleyi TaxID=313985 RepID=UPI003D0EBA30